MSGPASVERSGALPPPYSRLFAIAERSPRRAVALARRWHAAAAELPPGERALAAYGLGYALLRWERLGEAAPLLAAAEGGFAELGLGRMALHVRRARFYLAMLRGSAAALADEWAALAEEYARAGDTLSAGRANLGRMIQLNMQGLARPALELAAGLRHCFAAHGAPADNAWLRRVTAVAQINRGELDQALENLNAAAAGFAALRHPPELAKTWFEISRLYEFRGSFTLASEELERAYQVVRQHDLPLRIAFCEKNLGWLSTLRGYYDQGLQLSLQAHDRFLNLDRSEGIAECDLNLGNIAYYAGLADLALVAYERAEQIYNRLGFARMSLLCRRNQALAYRLQGRPALALERLGALIPLAEQLNEPLELAEAIRARGQALADLGRPAEAARAFARSEAIFQAHQSVAAAAESTLERGWLLLGQGELDPAAACFQAARPLLGEQPVHQWRADYGLGRCAEGRSDPGAASAFYQAACLTVAGLRRRLANEHASSGLFAQARRLLEHALDLARRQGDPAALLELAEQQRALALERAVRAARLATLQSLAEPGSAPDTQPGAGGSHPAPAHPGREGPSHPDPLLAYKEKRLRNPRLRPLADDPPPARLDLSHLRARFQAAFPAGWTLLAYIHCADQLLIVTLDPTGLGLAATPFDAQLRQLIARATSPGPRKLTYLGEGAAGGGWATLEALGERLLPAGLAERLRPEQRLLIVADGSLHGLPWGALRPGGHWLVELATPQILPGLLIWPRLPPRRPIADPALLVGVSQFGPRGSTLPNLPASLGIVARAWPGPISRLEESAATTGAIISRAGRGELRRYALVHLATHGQLAPASGLLAHLKLADDDLRYDEITRLGLDGALVVLAACEGAAAEVLPGEELLSLSRAFLAAGASDVIASQWQLYDNMAPALLDLLYAGLAAGQDAPTAVAEAQRAWLRRPGDSLAQAPLVWGSLCALGAGAAPDNKGTP